MLENHLDILHISYSPPPNLYCKEAVTDRSVHFDTTVGYGQAKGDGLLFHKNVRIRLHWVHYLEPGITSGIAKYGNSCYRPFYPS